jgi:hypothetical protein
MSLLTRRYEMTTQKGVPSFGLPDYGSEETSVGKRTTTEPPPAPVSGTPRAGAGLARVAGEWVPGNRAARGWSIGFCRQ